MLLSNQYFWIADEKEHVKKRNLVNINSRIIVDHMFEKTAWPHLTSYTKIMITVRKDKKSEQKSNPSGYLFYLI